MIMESQSSSNHAQTTLISESVYSSLPINVGHLMSSGSEDLVSVDVGLFTGLWARGLDFGIGTHMLTFDVIAYLESLL
ncbi:hypothetical protein AMELA_G00204360 [Ameiurus melas]|uniref:Uncharacterized protein n=1 Tax=Ameiurus melas TaxID=219545 RepID=A0A7J6A315_AMEME|nr:hypothetical protein AMELA_G00204360 [Ameiurus melas]